MASAMPARNGEDEGAKIPYSESLNALIDHIVKKGVGTVEAVGYDPATLNYSIRVKRYYAYKPPLKIKPMLEDEPPTPTDYHEFVVTIDFEIARQLQEDESTHALVGLNILGRLNNKYEQWADKQRQEDERRERWKFLDEFQRREAQRRRGDLMDSSVDPFN